MESHLLQMRGLKRYDALNMPEYLVASFTDAWIETIRFPCARFGRIVASFTDAWIETRSQSILYEKYQVASFTDAWIETR